MILSFLNRWWVTSIRRRRAVVGVCFVIAAGGCDTAPAARENLNSTLWIQSAVEYGAGTIGTFRAAAGQIETALKDPTWTASLEQRTADESGDEYRDLPPAVIVDVDETVLDNSPFQAMLIREERGFESELWRKWCRAESAESIPGAVAFARAAALRGVTVFYVTNRSHDVEASTRRNLLSAGFPVDETIDTVLTKGEEAGWGSDKGTRRMRVGETHRILLLVGDNLGDFLDGAATDLAARRSLLNEHRREWGRTWFALPNPTYGSWLAAVGRGERDLTPAEQTRRKLETLDTWRNEFRNVGDQIP